MEIPHIGRYGGLILHNFGFKELDAQAVFLLSMNEGWQIDWEVTNQETKTIINEHYT